MTMQLRAKPSWPGLSRPSTSFLGLSCREIAGFGSTPRWIISVNVAMSSRRRRCFAPCVIRVDDALCGAARCRGVALWQRGIGAFKVIVVEALVDLQADRIGRVIRLGPSRRRRQSHRDHQHRQSWNAHLNLFQYATAAEILRRLRSRHHATASPRSSQDAGWLPCGRTPCRYRRTRTPCRSAIAACGFPPQARCPSAPRQRCRGFPRSSGCGR
jgi:hypothetical protein